MTLIIEPILDNEPPVKFDDRGAVLATLAPKPLDGPNPRFAITDQLCACGCETQMPSTIVARGWQFLRGHKKGAGQIHNKVTRNQAAPRPGPVRSTSLSDVLGFLKESERVLAEQETEARATLERVHAQLKELSDRAYGLATRREMVKSALRSLDPAYAEKLGLQ